jgi:eukaryotic-like serine/threonine-protein kinase
VPGRALREYIDTDAPFDLRDAVTVLDQLCDALDYAHGQGVVHRDLKPENVIVTPQGRVKIGDFGIARSVSTATLTAAGTVLGSAHYLSPEQAQGEPASARSDIYAAGVMAYEMLTGLRPFSGDTALAVAMQHLEAEPPAPSRLNPRLPATIDAVVLKALAKRPYQRYARAMELADAVAAAAQPAPAGPVPAAAAVRAAADPLVATIAMPAIPAGRAMAVPMPAAPGLLRTGGGRQGRGRSGAWTGLIVGVLGLLFVLLAFLAGAQVLRSLPSVPNIVPPASGRSSPNGSPGSSGLAVADRTSTPTPRPSTTATGTVSPTVTETVGGTVTATVTESPTAAITPTVTETVPATPTAPPTWTATPRGPTNTPAPPPTATPPPGSVIVPSLVGLTEEQAQQTIKNVGLTPTFPNYQTFTSQPSGHVLSQQPPAGTAVAKGSTVYIAVRR